MLNVKTLNAGLTGKDSASRAAATAPILELAFRPYFLLASLSSIVALILWLGFLNGQLSNSSGVLNPTLWHAEQMIFGFAATVAVSFLLTAVQTWTGLPSLSAKPLLLFVALWLGARLLLLANIGGQYMTAALLLQAAWWGMAIIALVRLLLRSGNRRNYLFIPLLLVLASLHLTLLWLGTNGNTDIALHLARTAVLMMGVVMAVVGGRVIPFFTRAGLKRVNIDITLAQPNKWIEILLPIVSLLGVAVFFAAEFIELTIAGLAISPAALMISAGILHLLRLSRWQGIKTTSVSLLWSLHLSYLMLALGMILLGTSYLNQSPFVPNFSGALHVITVGAMGLMIVAMMSRVSLGHTGRALEPKRIVSLALLLMLLAALTRTLLPLLSLWQLGWNISGLLWLLSIGIFIWVYWPILTQAKQA